MNLTDAFNVITEIANEKRRTQDLEDLNNERSGAETGRIQRFLTGGNGSTTQQTKKEKEAAQFRTMLDILMQDQEYAALYNDTFTMLENAEDATERALIKAEHALEQVQEDHGQLMDKAAELPNGAKVFRDAEGNVWTADGKQLRGDDLNTIQWQGNEPSYKDYLDSKDKLDNANKSVFDLRQYQVDVLGRIRDDMSDPDNPPSADDMKRYQGQMKNSMPPAVKRELSDDLEQPQPISTTPQAIAIPSLD